MKAEKQQSRFVLCIRSEGSDDLEPRKVYQVLPDRAAVRDGYIRVIDESGEDYLYPAEYFVPVRFPVAIVREFLSPPEEASHPPAQRARPG
ncbi:MAG: hypothetical protein Q8N47_20930 [Bryobacterales bacterium]|nr:hypothetical protein [Bryobacterales bacterium]